MKKSAAQKTAAKRAWTILRIRGAFALFEELKCLEGMIACNALLRQLGAKEEKI